MSLRDRVRARVETDQLDPELDALIAEAQSAVRRKFGPDRSTATPLVPITVKDSRGGRIIDLVRPLDEAVTNPAPVVTEYSQGFITGDSQILVKDTDYRILNGGCTLERLHEGWYHRRVSFGRLVTVAYVPVNDQAERDEVVIKLVIAALKYEAVQAVKVGDVSTTHSDYQRERERLLASLAPRSGMVLA